MTSKAIEFKDKHHYYNDDLPSSEYQEGGGDKNLHWGQRKLLLALIQFLTQFWDKEKFPNPIVVYAGAAPGHNIVYVSNLFPTIEFHLYDPSPFKIGRKDKPGKIFEPNEFPKNMNKGIGRIYLYQELFTDETAKMWRNKDRDRGLYFISDIRTSKSKNPTEKEVTNDMYMQLGWYNLMKPERASLKFKLPYSNAKSKNFNYLDGLICFQSWAAGKTTETRLIPKAPFENKNYDIKKYEEILYYLNIETRQKQKYLNPYTNKVENIFGTALENNFDSLNEFWILAELHKKFDYLLTEEAMSSRVRDITEYLIGKMKWDDKYEQFLDMGDTKISNPKK